MTQEEARTSQSGQSEVGFWSILSGAFAALMLWTVVTRWITEIRLGDFGLATLGGWDTAVVIVILIVGAIASEVAKQ